MKANYVRLLKISSILMIIGGAFGTILGIMAVMGAIALTALAGSGASMILVAAVFLLGGGVVSLIAGILGIKNSAKPEKASVLIKFGVLALLFSLVGNIMTLTSGEEFSYSSVIIGLVVPVVYLYCAFQSKKSLT